MGLGRGYQKVNSRTLTNGTELAGHEVIRRPWTADDNFTVLELPSRSGIAVLILHDCFFIDQMSNIELHGARITFPATDLLFKRGEQLVHLDRECTRLGLAFALPDGLFPQLAPHAFFVQPQTPLCLLPPQVSYAGKP